MNKPIITNHVRERFAERFPERNLGRDVKASVALFADKWLMWAKETCTKPEHQYDYDRGLCKLRGLPDEGVVFVWREGRLVTVLDFTNKIEATL